MDAELAPSDQPMLERFDFGDAGHVTPEHLRMLRSLDEQLARNLTHALSAWLRVGVTVSAEPATQQTFREFLDRAENCYMLPVQLPVAHATGLLGWPLPLALQMIELLLGGSGVSAGAVRDLTDIEDEIFRAVLDVVFREWNLAWQGIVQRLEPGERFRNAGERQLMALGEKLYCFHLTVSTAETTGEVSFCIAAPVLASAMRGVPLLQRSSRTHTEADVEQLLTALTAARVRTGLCFPPVRIPAVRLRNLRAGSTLLLPLPSNAAAEFRVSEVPVATATPVRVGAWRAANITALREGPGKTTLLALSNSASTKGERLQAHG